MANSEVRETFKVHTQSPAKPASSRNNDSSNSGKLSRLPLSKSEAAAVYVLQNVSLTHREEVFHGDQVVDSIGEKSKLGFPGAAEHFHVFSGNLASRTIGQHLGSFDHLLDI